MEEKKLSNLTDQELLQEAKKRKKTDMINAALIGFLIGVIAYSIIKSTVGLFTLIPLYLAYKISNTSKYNKKELEDLLKERNLK